MTNWNNKEEVLKAVRQFGEALYYASEELKADKEVSNKEVLVKRDSESTKEHCVINKPKHYILLEGVEVRDVCTVLANRLAEGGYCGIFVSDFVQLLQYILRFDQKNGPEDLEKAKFYLDKLISNYNN
jgi:hypothetical protein